MKVNDSGEYSLVAASGVQVERQVQLEVNLEPGTSYLRNVL